MALNPTERHYHAKKYFNLKNKIDDLTIEANEHKEILLQDVEETGNKKFIWQDCRLNYVSGSEPKLVVNYRMACEKIQELAKRKGAVTQEEITEIINNCTKKDNGRKPYFR